MNELPNESLVPPAFPSISNTEAEVTQPESTTSPIKPRLKKILAGTGWLALGFMSFLLFTLIKVPEDRLKSYLVGTLNASLVPKGLALSAERGSLSIGWGITYSMKEVKLTPASGEKPFQISQLSIQPSLLPLLWGRQGGSAKVVSSGSSGDGELSLSFSMKDTLVSAEAELENFDAGQTGLFFLLSGSKGSLIGTGKMSFAGDWNIPSTVQTQGSFEFKKIRLDAQTLQGFQVPTLQLQEGRLNFETDKSKVFVRTLKLGKPGTADDIQATGTGEVTLSRTWDTSPLDLKLNFRFSESVTKSFVFLDALLGAGKKADGSYSYQLTGPLISPQFQPQP